MPFVPDSDAAKPTPGSVPDTSKPTPGFVPDSPAPSADQDPIGAYRQRHKSDSVGQKLKSIAFGDSDNPTVEGSAPLAMPSGPLALGAGKIAQSYAGASAPEALTQAPEGLAKLATFLGGSAPARVATGGAVGAAEGAAQTPQGDDTRLSNLIKGGGKGIAAGLMGESMGSLGQGLARPVGTVAMAGNPSKMKAVAGEAIDRATQKLQSSEAENLATHLGDKRLTIDTTRIRGINPDIDSILKDHALARSPYGDIPSEMEIPAADAHKIRQKLDGEIKYSPLGDTAERDAHIKAQADQIRGQLHDLSPEVSDTYDQWSKNLNESNTLDRGAVKSPVRTLTSSTPDRQGLLQDVDKETGSDLRGLGQQMNAASSLSVKSPFKSVMTLAGEAARGAAKPLARPNTLNSGLQQVFREGIFNKEK